MHLEPGPLFCGVKDVKCWCKCWSYWYDNLHRGQLHFPLQGLLFRWHFPLHSTSSCLGHLQPGLKLLILLLYSFDWGILNFIHIIWVPTSALHEKRNELWNLPPIFSGTSISWWKPASIIVLPLWKTMIDFPLFMIFWSSYKVPADEPATGDKVRDGSVGWGLRGGPLYNVLLPERELPLLS